MVPVVTLMVLDLVPERRGMASSLQAFVGSTANGVVAGVIAPLVMHSTLRARGRRRSSMMSIGVVAWLVVKPHMRPARGAGRGAAERVAGERAALRRSTPQSAMLVLSSAW